MNTEASLPEVGVRVMRERTDVRADVERIVQIWRDLLVASGGPMLYGEFGITDACFAPIVMKFKTYSIAVPAEINDYMDGVKSLPGIKTWKSQAPTERDLILTEKCYTTFNLLAHP